MKKKDKEDYQNCPVCGQKIGVIAGSKDAICLNCGFKDPCCE
jgi:DNA-directed RNA polymerase subunit RPC12/RpoP